MLVYRLAYIFREPVHRILKEWPLWEILSWGHFFDLVGPLDWRREDWRDARRHVYANCQSGTYVSEGIMFEEPEAELTDREKYKKALVDAKRKIAKMGEKFAPLFSDLFKQEEDI